MTHYKIVNDKEALENYIENVLPDLEKHEKFYVSLMSRKKYCKELKNANDSSVARFVAYKDELVHKIMQLEAPIDSYYRKGQIVPQHSLALYINPNPRCLRKATFATIKKLADELYNMNNNFNPQSAALTAIHNAKSRRPYMLIDVDDVDNVKSLKKHLDFLTDPVYIKTRGGCHIYIKPAIQEGKSWFQDMRGAFSRLPYDVDVIGDILTPVVGTLQSDFVPYIVE